LERSTTNVFHESEADVLASGNVIVREAEVKHVPTSKHGPTNSVAPGDLAVQHAAYMTIPEG
jgi:hypothetical protein